MEDFVCASFTASMPLLTVTSAQWCSGAGTPFRYTFWGRNGVPVVIRPPRQNATAAAFRQMFAAKIGFAYSEIRPCLM